MSTVGDEATKVVPGRNFPAPPIVQHVRVHEIGHVQVVQRERNPGAQLGVVGCGTLVAEPLQVDDQHFGQPVQRGMAEAVAEPGKKLKINKKLNF